MTLGQAVLYLLKRRSFYGLLGFVAVLFVATRPLVDRNRHLVVVPIAVGALALIYYLARVLTSARLAGRPTEERAESEEDGSS